MGTSANPMAGQYFNDPHFAAAVSNLAGAFAPPSAQEYLLAEQVKSERTSGAALADLYAQAGTDPDKLAYIANIYDPTQGLEAMRGGLANERYNTDTVAATSRTNNAADNDRAMREALLTGAMNPAGRQDMNAELLDAILPGINAPGVSAAGPVAPTDAQIRGDMIADARDDGLISNDDIYAMTMGDVPTQQIVTDSGNRLTFGPLAARDGAEPYNPTGGTAAPDPVLLIDPDTGARVSGFATPQGTYVLGDGKTPAPASLVAYKLPQIQGTADETGIGKTTMNENDRRFIASARGMEVVDEAIVNFTENPGTQGGLGAARRIFNGAAQTLREIGAISEGTDASSIASLLQQGLIDEAVAMRLDPDYNPALTDSQILGNMVVWAYASAQQPDGRVSNQQFDEAMNALGLSGMFATNADAITAATRVKTMLQRDYNSTASLASPALVTAYSPEVRNAGVSGAPAPAATTPAPGATTILRFDANGDQIP